MCCCCLGDLEDLKEKGSWKEVLFFVLMTMLLNLKVTKLRVLNEHLVVWPWGWYFCSKSQFWQWYCLIYSRTLQWPLCLLGRYYTRLKYLVPPSIEKILQRHDKRALWLVLGSLKSLHNSVIFIDYPWFHLSPSYGDGGGDTILTNLNWNFTPHCFPFSKVSNKINIFLKENICS